MPTLSTVELKKPRLYIISGIIGNIVEHYDTALFGFLAPFIAPLFFPTLHPLTALILAYAILPLDLIAKPLGALAFGRIGDRFGRTRALSLSITCTAVCTGIMGCIPTYAHVGALAPLILALTRFFQKFFSAGECIGAAIFILEQHRSKHKGFLGSLYSCSTMIGILLASALTSYFESFGLIQTYWRYLFWIGFATSLIGIYIRYNTRDGDEFLMSKRADHQPLFKTIEHYWRPFLAIVAAAGFSYTTYEISFIFLNSYAPLIADVTAAQMLLLNTGLITLDMALLPLFGLFADKISPTRQMQLTSAIALIASIPLMALCENGSYFTIVCIRSIWMVIGVAFCASFHAWSQELIPVRHRYTLISLAYTIGSQLIGAPFASVGLWLYKVSQLAFLPGLYLAVVALFTLISLRFTTVNTQQKLVFLPDGKKKKLILNEVA